MTTVAHHDDRRHRRRRHPQGRPCRGRARRRRPAARHRVVSHDPARLSAAAGLVAVPRRARRGRRRRVRLVGRGSRPLPRPLEASGSWRSTDRTVRNRRRRGKSDVLDAEAAARAVLAGQATATPKAGTGPVEALRQLRVARSGAMKARTAAANQIHSLCDTAPDAIRAQLVGLTMRKKIARRRTVAARPVDDTTTTRPSGPSPASPAAGVALDDEARALQHHSKAILDELAPPLLAVHGVGYDTAAQLLVTAGDNPAPPPTRTQLRRALRRNTRARLLGPNQRPTSPQPRRRPPRQLRALAHRDRPHGHPPGNQDLRRTPHQRRHAHHRDHPLPQALRRPRALPPHPSHRRPPHHRPSSPRRPPLDTRGAAHNEPPTVANPRECAPRRCSRVRPHLDLEEPGTGSEGVDDLMKVTVRIVGSVDVSLGCRRRAGRSGAHVEGERFAHSRPAHAQRQGEFHRSPEDPHGCRPPLRRTHMYLLLRQPRDALQCSIGAVRSALAASVQQDEERGCTTVKVPAFSRLRLDWSGEATLVQVEEFAHCPRSERRTWFAFPRPSCKGRRHLDRHRRASGTATSSGMPRLVDQAVVCPASPRNSSATPPPRSRQRLRSLAGDGSTTNFQRQRVAATRTPQGRWMVEAKNAQATKGEY